MATRKTTYADLEARVRAAYEYQSAIPGDEDFWTPAVREICETGTPTVFVYLVDVQGKRRSDPTRFVIRLGYRAADGRKCTLLEDPSEVHMVSPITNSPEKIARLIAESRYGKGTAFRFN